MASVGKRRSLLSPLAPFFEEEQWPGLGFFFLKEKLREGRVALCTPAPLEEGGLYT